MKKDVNGKIFEMTAEEIQAKESEVVDIPPTEAERIEALEEAIIELAGVLVNG